MFIVQRIMDSSLLNVDTYDGSFAKLDNDSASIWAHSNDSIGCELTETLNGLMPMVGSDESGGEEIYDDTAMMLSEDVENQLENHGDILHENNTTSVLVYRENGKAFYDSDIREDLLANNDIEIITLDPTTMEVASYGDDDDFVDDYVDNTILTDYVGVDTIVDEEDVLSQFSASSFRTRTDSSSIGDYESHTSDYEDSDNDDDGGRKDNVVELENNNIDDGCLLFDKPLLISDGMLLEDDLKFAFLDMLASDDQYGEERKKRTISTNTIGSDVDGLGVVIDANTFDLADFITKDDIELQAEKSKIKETISQSQSERKCSGHSYQGKKIDYNSDDSDVIVDVETVELDNDDYGIDHFSRESPRNCARTGGLLKDTRIGKSKDNFEYEPVSLLEKNSKDIPVEDIDDSKQNSQTSVKEEEKFFPIVSNAANENIENSISKPHVKRKLNIEEYKMRRNNAQFTVTTPMPQEIKQSEKSSKELIESKQGIVNGSSITQPITVKKHSEEVTSIVKTLKEQQQLQRLNNTTTKNNKETTDPITEARNKVLRMQEIKRAQQIKIIDSTVSKKVPRVTKVLPLMEIISGKTMTNNKSNTMPCKNIVPHCNPDYEEITIVSASCNTDISIPPLNALLNQRIQTIPLQRISTASRSLLKSSILLQKVQATENMKLASNSLIASIQNAVVMKSLPTFVQQSHNDIQTSTTNCIKVHKQEPHGEDKIIMHLRKDRIRKTTHNMATQTDLLPEFPIFPMPTSRRKKRQYRQRNRCSQEEISHSVDDVISSSSSSSPSSGDEKDEGDAYYHIRSSPARSSCADSSSGCGGQATVSGADTVGGYSSRSTRRHRSSVSSSYSETEGTSRHRRQRRTSFKQRTRQHSRSSRASSASSSSCSTYTGTTSRQRQQQHQRMRSRSPLCRDRTAINNVHQNGYQHKSNGHNNNNRSFADRNVSQPAVEERRIVYVGRIEPETNKEMLRKKFSAYGRINQITIHYKDTGMKYGFVTFERSQDAFAAIDSCARDSQIRHYDVSFGGRRAFCRASYADLDNAGINTYQSYVFPKSAPPPRKDDSFEALLLQVKAKMNASKVPPVEASSTTTCVGDSVANASLVEVPKDSI